MEKSKETFMNINDFILPMEKEVKEKLELILVTLKMLDCRINSTLYFHKDYLVMNTSVYKELCDHIVLQVCFSYETFDLITINLVGTTYDREHIYNLLDISFDCAYERLIHIF